ncbi:MAG: MFS transporter [Dehalococcoidia bacterium]|nr:MFS transporter [Dehalococcoidia bacterium]
MLWVLPGALGVYIAKSLQLTQAEKGLVVAVPILSGALLRLPMGLLSDQIGAKRVGMGMLAFLFLPLALGWQAGNSLQAWLGIGLLLGTAGASFAVALPLASRWYPPERQGLVMGIAAAGNSGTVIANLLAPRLANQVGWHNVLGLAMLPLALVLVVFVLAAKDAPKIATSREVLPLRLVLRQADLWWFCLLYSITFGGYVGLTSFFPLFLRGQYETSPVTAGYLTALVAFAGSAVRPLGGYLADRFGGTQMLSLLLVAVGTIYAAISFLPPLGALMLLATVGIACLGMGNGAVFQLVPRRFQGEIGIATGVVGAFGGIGGFLLPNLLANVKGISGSYGPGFLVLTACCFGVLFALRGLALLSSGWRLSWGTTLVGTTLKTGAPERVQMAPYML